MWVEDLPNGKFKFVERYYDHLTNSYKKASTTLTSKSPQANKKANAILQKKIEAKLNFSGDRTYSETLVEFKKYYKATVKTSTLTRATLNLNILNKKIEPNALVGRIEPQYIEDILFDLHTTDNYSKSTINQMKSILTMYFEYCRRRGYCQTNPIRDVDIKFKPEKALPMSEKYLTQDEIKIFLDYMRPRHKRYADMTELMIMTGLRFGELTSLTTSDYTDKSITINDSKTTTGLRTVTLTDRCAEILDEMIAENTLNELKTDLICATKKGNQVLNPNYNRWLAKAVKAVGINKPITAHTLRHTHITLLAKLGVDVKTIMHRVGHAKPEVTLGVYTHVTDEMNKSAVEKLNNLPL